MAFEFQNKYFYDYHTVSLTIIGTDSGRYEMLQAESLILVISLN